MMRHYAVIALTLASGCGDDPGTVGTMDFAIARDMAVAPERDLTVPSACSPVDPMTDGTPCASGCPAGTIGVNSGVECKCWQECDPATPQVCPCSRRCAGLLSSDGGAAGGACLKANGPGERCGAGGSGPNADGCSQGLFCVNADDPGLFRYCVYDCAGGKICPTQTSCLTLTDSATGMEVGQACAYISVTTGIAPGAACDVGRSCQSNFLCETSLCRPQCDRAGAACAGGGSCTAFTDSAGVIAYVCK